MGRTRSTWRTSPASGEPLESPAPSRGKRTGAARGAGGSLNADMVARYDAREHTTPDPSGPGTTREKSAWDLGVRLGATSERAADGGLPQSYTLALSIGRGAAASLPAEFGTLEWTHHWWALGVE